MDLWVPAGALLPQERQMGHVPLWSPGAPLRAFACPPADICQASALGGARSMPGRGLSPFLGLHMCAIVVSGS